MTVTKSAPKTPEISQEQIDRERPAMTWLAPQKHATIARYLLRRGYRWVRESTSAPLPTRSTPADLTLLTGAPMITDPAATTVRVWHGSGMIVVTGPQRNEIMDLIARLRVSREAEAEDNDHPGGYRNDTRLYDIPGYLRD
jgi:hypothetical protein